HQILGAVDRARDAEDERADVFRRYIDVESISGNPDEKRTQRRAGNSCPPSFVVTYRPICGYIFQSVWQCQLVDNRVIIKRFLSASADSKVCIELLDTFRVIPENLALREKNRISEVGAFDRRRTADESKSNNSGVSTAIHANSDYKRKTECP
ncbi:hypothetical protein, partial [uncultured Alistipes sp.]